MLWFSMRGKRGGWPEAISSSSSVAYTGFSRSPTGKSMVRPPSAQL